MPAWFWVASALAIFCLWPLLLPAVAAANIALVAGLILLLATTVAVAWRRVSSPALGYFEGLGVIADAFAFSLSDTVTALYIGNFINFAHLAAFWFAVRSFFEPEDAGRRRWYRFVRKLYERRYGQDATPFDAMLTERRRPPEGLRPLPRSARPWYQRYFLLYPPRDANTLIYHLGFLLGIFAAAGLVFVFLSPDVPEEIRGDDEVLWGMLLFIGIGVYSWRVARMRDSVARMTP